ncbi:hypothetical protein HYPSUDRAFT_142347, partial [Hypholoma sublateritium FD-334 SS-4]
FDSAQHVDAPKCHPHTRTAVLNEIMDWIMLAVTRLQWILWLKGAAGAGKSAIGRSIVELCLQREIPIARFFFFRTDPSRNTVAPVIATLVHQILQCIPALTEIILPIIQSDPLIFNKSLETQFEYLVFKPLRQLHNRSLYQQTLVLLFDGLDECHNEMDQVSLIRILSSFVGTTAYPVMVFFASRAENHISVPFKSPGISQMVWPLNLDHHYSPDDDIRLFLVDSFLAIKNTHPFGHLLDNNWPSESEVEEVVIKSSGQFVYVLNDAQ